MTVQQNLLLNRGNDETVNLSITQASGAAYNLAGVTVNFYIKPSALTPDGDASVTLLSTATSGVTVTDAQNGLVTAVIPHAVLQIPVARFWRCDIVSGSTVHTAQFGMLSVGYR